MTFICQLCGAEFERNPEETHKVFCSPECYHKFKSQTKTFTCPHNDAVGCSKKKCNVCGWHPTIAKARMDKLLGKNGVKANG